ncbi:hypothetical protein ACQKIE_18040 [Luteibacter sp. NPDC031894]|uniref:hypothetical protein n=1 Tax=Luteibacter sp. NPDC031894 TaxID=3390572 RepID=UPI003CFFFBF8
MKLSCPPFVQGRVVVRLVVCTLLACVVAACGGREQQQDERAKRARQMRDVSRMLDAMEADTSAAGSSTAASPALPAPRVTIPGATDDGMSRGPGTYRSLFATLALAIAGGLAVSGLATFAWRRKQRVAMSTTEGPSLVGGVAEPFVANARPPAAPSWTYRRSSFETPHIHMLPEPVDLLVPAHVELHGESDAASSLARAAALAQRLRIDLARAASLSGATRLLAIRTLAATFGHDPDVDHPLVVDARVDMQLAWASWVVGDAAEARFVEAERLCELLADAEPEANAHALRRRGEIRLRRAERTKDSDALAELDRAQACFDGAHAQAPDAATALLVAQAALRRARLLPPGDATDACSHALVHAFLAEHDPACRTDALACRLDVQLLYETLPHHAGLDGITASLGRSLEAAGPLAPAARTALAEAALRDGDAARAASLCESLWRDGNTDIRSLAIWRAACRDWASADGHDEQSLARSLRHLAIARSTL